MLPPNFKKKIIFGELSTASLFEKTELENRVPIDTLASGQREGDEEAAERIHTAVRGNRLIMFQKHFSIRFLWSVPMLRWMEGMVGGGVKGEGRGGGEKGVKGIIWPL